MVNRDIRKRYCFDESEFAEDEIYLPQESFSEPEERCVQCGFPILQGEEALEILPNGETIHRQCWEEYSDENIGLFAKSFGVKH